MTEASSVVDARQSPESNAPYFMETVGLRRDFQGVQAVRGVDLRIRRGSLTGLIGPNGAGKSTVLQMLSGMIRPTAGQIVFEGRDVTTDSMHVRARSGLVRTFQQSSEFKRLTVVENLMSSVPDHPGDSLRGSLLGRRHWRRAEETALDRARSLLDRFRLSAHADSYAGDLSGGQRRLVEIMRALMATPKLLLLDEPMAGVHPRLALEIAEHLARLRDEGMTIVMVEHELGLVDLLCEPVYVLAEGKVLAEGTMAALRQQSDVVDAYLVG